MLGGEGGGGIEEHGRERKNKATMIFRERGGRLGSPRLEVEEREIERDAKN